MYLLEENIHMNHWIEWYIWI